MRRHPWRAACLSLFVVFVLLNLLAYSHARAMTHFVRGGSLTARPESLSWPQKLRVLLTGVRIPKPLNKITPDSVGFAFSTHRFDTADGISLEAWQVPHPRPRGVVLLFHGYAACKANLLPEARAFHELGYATWLIDFRGSGGSDGAETTIGIREAEDVAAAVRYVQSLRAGQRVILYGQSMGSAAILRAVAVHGVRPDALILENSFDRLFTTVANRFRALGVPSFPAAQLLVFWGGVQQQFNGFQHNPVDYARNVDCPVLLLHGADDPRVAPVEAEAVFANLSGAKRLVLLTGVGHEPCLAASPECWTQSVLPFLDQHLRR
jgi:alpha-beta hydrolase superfamily lysophospholipase